MPGQACLSAEFSNLAHGVPALASHLWPPAPPKVSSFPMRTAPSVLPAHCLAVLPAVLLLPQASLLCVCLLRLRDAVLHNTWATSVLDA